MLSLGQSEMKSHYKTLKLLVENMRRLVRKYDKSRPVTIALNGGFYDSFAAKASDVVGVNYNLTGYDKFPLAHPNKCILATESVASGNNRGIYTTVDDNNPKKSYSTAYDRKRASFGSTFKDAVEASETHPFVGGTFIWSGIEYRGEAAWPKLFSSSAPIDNCGFEKDSFYLLSAYWKDEDILHIMPHWTFPENIGEEIEVCAYTNQDEVELFLNGESLGKKSRDNFEMPSWNVKYVAGELKAVAYKNGKETMTTIHKTASKPVKLHLYEESLGTTNSGLDTVIINAYCTDENGNFVPNATNRVKFTCDENAEIIAVSGGDPINHEDPKAFDKEMFGGRVQAILRVKEKAKTVTITAIADGGLDSDIEVKIQDVKTPLKLEASKKKLSISTFRYWNDIHDSVNAVDKQYNFDDMNSSQPISLPLSQKPEGNGFNVLTAKTVMPLCDDTLSIKFDNICGKGKIKVFHDGNCWPHPEPKEFITIVKDFDFSNKTEFVVPLKKFSANEKVNMVVVFDKSSDFNLDDTSFVK